MTAFVMFAGNVQEASRLLGSKDVRVNCLDEVRKCSTCAFQNDLDYKDSFLLVLVLLRISGVKTCVFFLMSNLICWGTRITSGLSKSDVGDTCTHPKQLTSFSVFSSSNQ